MFGYLLWSSLSLSSPLPQPPPPPSAAAGREYIIDGGARRRGLPRIAGEKEPVIAVNPHRQLPHLLAVGAGNSFDPDPAGFGQEAEWGAGCCCCLSWWRGNRAATAATGVFKHHRRSERLRIFGQEVVSCVQVRSKAGRRLLPRRASRTCMSGQARMSPKALDLGTGGGSPVVPQG